MKNTKLMGTVLAVLMLFAMTGCSMIADSNFTPVTKVSEIQGKWKHTKKATTKSENSESLLGINTSGSVTDIIQIKRVNSKWVYTKAYNLQLHLTKENGNTFSNFELGSKKLAIEGMYSIVGAKAELDARLSNNNKTLTIEGWIEGTLHDNAELFDADISVLNFGNAIQINSMGNRLQIGEGKYAITYEKTLF